MDPHESEFAAALLAADLPPPRGLAVPRGASAARRFAVYRNNVVAGLIRALENRFRVVSRLVGAEFFRSMAEAFVRENPPRSPIMFRYGEAFPAFVEGFAPAAGVPYLADIARLELARGRAYYAADAAPLPAMAFGSLRDDVLELTTLILHPSVEILSSAFPVVSIWRAHQGNTSPGPVAWVPEAALVARPGLGVELHLLPPGGDVFIAALDGGASFARAATIATTEVPEFDPVRNLALLIDARIGVRLASAR